jgi:hypothetical protein
MKFRPGAPALCQPCYVNYVTALCQLHYVNHVMSTKLRCQILVAAAQLHQLRLDVNKLQLQLRLVKFL